MARQARHILLHCCNCKPGSTFDTIMIHLGSRKEIKSLTANRKLLKANPPLMSVTGDHHGVQCVNQRTPG
uniref:SFRICE_000298 n=1 Tax=Spodoptera frugiperda TaxID=7108 RepID=A0A2H1V5S9_SPOFR